MTSAGPPPEPLIAVAADAKREVLVEYVNALTVDRFLDAVHERQHALARQRRAVRRHRTVRAMSAVGGSVWDRLAACESGGDWSANTGNGYYGGLQFDLPTWRSNGGHGYPHQQPRVTQIAVAERLRARRGFAPWPVCSRRLGLR